MRAGLKNKQRGFVAALAIIGSAAASYSGSQAAAGAAKDAAAQNLQYQQEYNRLADPFGTSGARAQYVPMLNQLMQGGYAGLQNDPMYKQLQDIGSQGVQRRMSAMGQGFGTNDMLAINRNQQQTAMDYFNQKYSMLSELSGATAGRMQPLQGMDPRLAGGIAYAPYQTAGEMVGGLAGLYGSKQ